MIANNKGKENLMKTLITFLGRTKKIDNGYRKTRYNFGDGKSEELAFFGWALTKRVQPEKLVILGTSGSMWDHLFEGDYQFGEEQEEARINLVEAVEQKKVNETMLTPLVSLLEKQINAKVVLRIVPSGLEEKDQIKLLQILAEEITKGASLELDITHAYRHLPMIALSAIQYLQLTKNITIKNVWYGSYDEDSKQATVHLLGGLLKMAEGISALTTYNKDGDYSTLAKFVNTRGDLLEKAAYFERSSNPVKAQQTLTSWVNLVKEESDNSDPIASLFQDELKQRISWYKGSSRADWEKALAYEYLERKDFVRAVTYALEGAISCEVIRQKLDHNDFNARENCRNELKDTKPGFKVLNKLRNALAHGVKPTDKQVNK